MKEADVFVFPREENPKEGLGIVVVEAQAAGMPMFITNGITRDAIVIEQLVHCNDLLNPAEWARQIADVLEAERPISRNEAIDRMRQSPFDLGRATKNLVDIYER